MKDSKPTKPSNETAVPDKGNTLLNLDDCRSSQLLFYVFVWLVCVVNINSTHSELVNSGELFSCNAHGLIMDLQK